MLEKRTSQDAIQRQGYKIFKFGHSLVELLSMHYVW